MTGAMTMAMTMVMAMTMTMAMMAMTMVLRLKCKRGLYKCNLRTHGYVRNHVNFYILSKLDALMGLLIEASSGTTAHLDCRSRQFALLLFRLYACQLRVLDCLAPFAIALQATHVSLDRV